jgi:hypothetical protein
MERIGGLLTAVAFSFAGAFLSDASAQSPNVTVFVTGSGPSIDDAKTDAIRQALQLTMRQLVIVDRVISGDTVVRDRVMSTMNGYIEQFTPKDIHRTNIGYAV